MTREYRWAIAHARAHNAWMRPDTLRKHAYAVARAQCEIQARIEAGDSKCSWEAQELACDPKVVCIDDWFDSLS